MYFVRRGTTYYLFSLLNFLAVATWKKFKTDALNLVNTFEPRDDKSKKLFPANTLVSSQSDQILHLKGSY